MIITYQIKNKNKKAQYIYYTYLLWRTCLMSNLMEARGIMAQKHRTSISDETNIYWKV